MFGYNKYVKTGNKSISFADGALELNHKNARSKRILRGTWSEKPRETEQPWIDYFEAGEDDSRNENNPYTMDPCRSLSDSEDEEVVKISFDFKRKILRPSRRPFYQHQGFQRHEGRQAFLENFQSPFQRFVSLSMERPISQNKQHTAQGPIQGVSEYGHNAAVQEFSTNTATNPPNVVPLVAHMPKYQRQYSLPPGSVAPSLQLPGLYSPDTNSLQVQPSKASSTLYQASPVDASRYKQAVAKKAKDDESSVTGGPGDTHRQWRKLVYYIPVDKDGNTLPAKAYHVRPQAMNDLLKRGEEGEDVA